MPSARTTDYKEFVNELENGVSSLGWLYNIQQYSITDPELGVQRSAISCFFVSDTGSNFKVNIPFQPYFYIEVNSDSQHHPSASVLADVEHLLRRRLDNFAHIEQVIKEDLTKANHLIDRGATFLKVSFHNTLEHNTAVREVQKLLKIDSNSKLGGTTRNIIAIREFDVSLTQRATIDLNLRVGYWYKVFTELGHPSVELQSDLVERAQLRVLAYDIETTKAPLKFPDANVDVIMMISYMIDGHGYLITNREVVSEDISDFDFNPMPEYQGNFKVFNELNEKLLIERFIDHIKEEDPHVIVTYNGDFFDFPFVDKRAAHHGISLENLTGFSNTGTETSKQYTARSILHLDCFYWVKRDSYLPQGSHGLKAVTKAKLGFDPYEIDPELMVPYAKEKPQYLASYSVSDALCTYYLYFKYIHGFIFSLCNIVPYSPDEVLRKGSGALCEALLMARAFNDNIIAPDKQSDLGLKYGDDGFIIDTETYVGARVEALTSGVFRKDIPIKFDCNPDAFDELIDKLDGDLRFALEKEGGIQLSDVVNYEEIRDQIRQKLENLKNSPSRTECPLIYHLDVGAMYPNIILTNRLQPCSVVSERDCLGCGFNEPGAKCKRKMQWVWRGQMFPLKKGDFVQIKNQLLSEDPEFNSKTDAEKASLYRKRLSLKSRKTHTAIHKVVEEVRDVTICQKENPFYVNTVRMFRDRRYEYKAKQKQWKAKLSQCQSPLEIDHAKGMIVIYDSLQLAHKCILNSFYGYVMRSGSRWHSIEMAGVVTNTGVEIITQARKLVERIGVPLELDTDGIWCMLPSSFPEDHNFQLTNGKSYTISYPCVMLNADVDATFTNPQYHHEVLAEDQKPMFDKKGRPKYELKPECSIFFEVDGPYRAMILPASTEEGRLLKKRYAVFNDDGSLAELKGFEIKRRGELQLIKLFQQEVFKVFLEGNTLDECYKAVGSVANKWLTVLHSKGEMLQDEEVVDLLSESKNMSKNLSDYGDQKSVAITTAKKLAEWLGKSITEDSSLVCKFFISKYPAGLAVNERAVPVNIFHTSTEVQKEYLSRWCGVLDSYEIKSLIDWDYYLDRFETTVRKIITIPAALQKISNPCPLVNHPSWLQKNLKEEKQSKNQLNLIDLFAAGRKRNADQEEELKRSNIESFDESVPAAESINDEEVIDLEDGDNQSSNKSNPTKLSQMSLFGQTMKKVLVFPRNSSEVPDWIKNMKKSWEVKIEKRRERRNLFKKANFSFPAGCVHSRKQLLKLERESTSSMTSILGGSSSSKISSNSTVRSSSQRFGSIEERLASDTWNILSLIPLDKFGNFSAWVTIKGSLVSVNITLPRIFYIQSGSSDFPQGLPESVEIKKVSKSPPRGDTGQSFMFEVGMPEELFQERREKVTGIKYAKDVYGIFEIDVPLDFRAIVRLGAKCRVNNNVSRSLIRGLRLTNDGFALGDLIKVTGDPTTPLALENLSILYCTLVTAEKRSVAAVFSRRFKKLHIVFANATLKSGIAGNLTVDDVIACNQSFSDWNVSITNARSHAEIFAIFEKFILSEISYNSGTNFTFLVKQGDELSSKWNGSTYFPNITLSNSPKDVKSLNNSDSFTWMPNGLRMVIDQHSQVDSRLTSMIDYSLGVNIPLSNLSNDVVLQSSDVFLARLLNDDNHLLWTSDSSVVTSTSSIFKILNPNSDRVPVQSGVFRTTTVDIRLYFFFANALMTQSVTNSSNSLLENNDLQLQQSPCYSQLTKIVKFLNFCSNRAQSNLIESTICNEILKNFGRYISSNRSLLYDPELFSICERISALSLQNFCTFIKETRATVLLASTDSIKINTMKDSRQSAQHYVESLTEALAKNNEFANIELKAKQYLSPLLLIDATSFIGIIQSDSITHDGRPTGYLHLLNDSRFAEVADTVTKLLGYYLTVSQKLLNYVEDYSVNGTMPPFPFDPTMLLSFVQPFEGISEDHKLSVGALRGLFHGSFADNYDFRKVAGLVARKFFRKSKKQEVDPCLGFVSIICTLLEHDPAISPIISSFKDSLLTEIYKFVPEFEFTMDYPSLLISNLLCTTCNMSTSLDLCREPWNCKDCGAPLNDGHIESFMVNTLNSVITAYQKQDLVCSHCKLGSSSLINSLCSNCQGTLKLSVTVDDVKHLVKPYRYILQAKDGQSFPALEEVLQLFP
ncbi:hypothetical protein P9112_005342 [Eukaryota sp. TZLM1-RC]